MNKLMTLKEIEKHTIMGRLMHFDGNRKLLAESLGISIGGLEVKMKRFGLTKPRGLKNRRGVTIEGWIEEIRKLNVKSNREWRQKSPSSYNYMSTKGMIQIIASALGMEMIPAGRPAKKTKTEGENL